MNLTTEDVALLRSLVEWRRENGWSRKVEPRFKDTRCAEYEDAERWWVDVNRHRYDNGTVEWELIADDVAHRCHHGWPRSLREAVDVLVAIGLLPRRFSSAFAAGRESAYTTDDPKIDFMDWDYKEQPDMEELARIVAERSGGKVHITQVPYAGGQEYAIAVCDRKLGDDEALEAYRAWERERFEESFHA